MANETLTSVDAIVSQFVERWRCGERPEVEKFLPAEAGDYRGAVLLALIKADLKERARAGEQVRLEDYLRRFPELGPAAELPLELIVEEYKVRNEHGGTAGLEEYARRFPVQIAALRQKVEQPTDHRQSSEASNVVEIGPGECVGDFQIIRLLGEGALSRVYLATQLSLDRTVALKVSPAGGQSGAWEGRTLAALEHEHIVPVYAEQVAHGRRLLAMRYVPGITLARLFELLCDKDRQRCTGRELYDLVQDEVTKSLHSADGPQAGGTPHSQPLSPKGRGEKKGPASLWVTGQSFTRTVCGIIAGLARGLEHAHRHGVLHRDIKPANILIDQHGRGLLMDFNIAIRKTQQAQEVFGGTPAYMAPEHLSALGPQTPGTPEQVDERSDIYSLGVVFYELLTGRHPFCQAESARPSAADIPQMLAERLQGVPAARSAGVRISPGLESIIAKCLAPQPGDRYQSAGELAEDLERFLDDRPLRFAPDRSWSERAKKWLRRHRVAVSILAAVVGVYLALTGRNTCNEWRDVLLAEQLVLGAVESLQAGEFQRAAQLLDQIPPSAVHGGQATLPFVDFASRRSALLKKVSQGHQAVALAEYGRFEKLANQARAMAVSLRANHTHWLALDPLTVFHVLERDNWMEHWLFKSLDAQQRARIEDDVTELLLIRCLESGAPDPVQAGRVRDKSSGVDLLARIPIRHARRFAVEEVVRASRGEPFGESLGELLSPPDEWTDSNLYFMGVVAAKRGQFEEALRFMAIAIERSRASGQSPNFWLQFYHALCCAKLGRIEQAISGYSICIGIEPDFAWPHHNLGLVYAEQGNFEQAAVHFRDSIACDSKLAPAYCNLAGALLRVNQPAPALESASKAIELGYEAAEAYANRGAARAATGDRSGAIEDLKRALAIDPDCEAAKKNLALLLPERDR